jgi:ribosomal protein S18 acetylase RimI-like enzyme
MIGQSALKMEIKEINRFSMRVFNAVLKLLSQLVSDSKSMTEDHFRGILKSEKTHFFIAELDNKQIAGMLTIGTYDIPSGTKVWIEDVVVDESQRGKGICKELTLFAIGFAKSLDAESVELTSRPSRIAANKLYKKLGFVLRETNVYRYTLKSDSVKQITKSES